MPPARPTVELALRVAEREAAKEVGRLYWRGAVDALLWALGHQVVAPVSSILVTVDLDEPRRATVMSEAEHAYHGMHGTRPNAELGLRYLTGVENTCMWIATGSGIGLTLDPES